MSTVPVQNGKISVYTPTNQFLYESLYNANAGSYGPLSLSDGTYKVIASAPDRASSARIISIDSTTEEGAPIAPPFHLLEGMNTYIVLLRDKLTNNPVNANVVVEINQIFATKVDNNEGEYLFSGDNKIPTVNAELILKILNDANIAPLERILPINSAVSSIQIATTPKLRLNVSVKNSPISSNTGQYNLWLLKGGKQYKQFTFVNQGTIYVFDPIWEGTHTIGVYDDTGTLRRAVNFTIDFISNPTFSTTVIVSS
jgi:hypothetical protein